jgi:hypothetical protein
MKNCHLTPGITRREALTEASNLADDITALSGRVHADVRLPVLEIIQCAPPAAKGIIQRPLAMSRVRGSAAARLGRELSTEL